MPLEGELPGTPPNVGDTLLTISGFGSLLYQARGLSQSLEVIPQSKYQMRTINGVLTDVSNPIFRKYSSLITCTDVNTPPFDALWPGMQVEVECAAYLCYLTGNTGSPGRTVASGSEYVNGNYTFYRPVLTMLVGELRINHDEWKADVQWSLPLEEV